VYVQNAGAASVESVTFKDTNGNIVFQVGGEVTTAVEKEETTDTVVATIVIISFLYITLSNKKTFTR
jgi:hypothetical protein